MEKHTLAFVGVAILTALVVGAATAYFVVASSGPGSSVTLPSGNPAILVVLPGSTSFNVSSSLDCVASHYSLNLSLPGQSTFAGGFSAGRPGVTMYVATSQEAGTIYQGHPASWVYSTGLVNSSTFSVLLSPGSYVVWIEGADQNCGSSIVMPLEMLTQVNITQAFTTTPA